MLIQLGDTRCKHGKLENPFLHNTIICDRCLYDMRSQSYPGIFTSLRIGETIKFKDPNDGR